MRILEARYEWSGVLSGVLRRYFDGPGKRPEDDAVSSQDASLITSLEEKVGNGGRGVLVLAAMMRPLCGMMPLIKKEHAGSAMELIETTIEDPSSWPTDLLRVRYGKNAAIVSTTPAALILFVANAGLSTDADEMKRLYTKADKAWPKWRSAQAWIWENAPGLPLEYYLLNQHCLPRDTDPVAAEVFVQITQGINAVHDSMRVRTRHWLKQAGRNPARPLLERMRHLGQTPAQRASAVTQLKAAAEATGPEP